MKALMSYAAISTQKVERTANQIIQKGGKALGLACDVTRREQVDAMIQRAIEEFGSAILVQLGGY